MKLGDVLRFAKEELLDDKSTLLEGAPDELHSDEGLVTLIADGQRQLARAGCLLFDEETEAVTQIPLVEDSQAYELHASIIQVVHARVSDDERHLARLDRVQMSPQTRRTPEYWDVNQPATVTPGRPTAWSTNNQSRRIMLDRPASATEEDDELYLQLGVIRLPIQTLAVENTDIELEIPEEHHLALAFYAAGMKAVARSGGGNGDADMRRAGMEWLKVFNNKKAAVRKEAIQLWGARYSFVFGGWAAR